MIDLYDNKKHLAELLMILLSETSTCISIARMVDDVSRETEYDHKTLEHLREAGMELRKSLADYIHVALPLWKVISNINLPSDAADKAECPGGETRV